jgi:hypothetical protein
VAWRRCSCTRTPTLGEGRLHFLERIAYRDAQADAQHVVVEALHRMEGEKAKGSRD